MGGFGSGEWHTARYPRVEDCCVLSAAWLRARGAIRAGCMVTGTASWTRSPGNEPAGSTGYSVNLFHAERPSLRLSYAAVGPSGARRPVDKLVPLVATRPNYGGARWWFAYG